MYVCVYVCMYEMYACIMYVCMYVRMYTSNNIVSLCISFRGPQKNMQFIAAR